jgi:hypothetical protein
MRFLVVLNVLFWGLLVAALIGVGILIGRLA